MLKSAKSWKCSKGCKLTRVPCEHLEKLLPQMRLRNSNRIADKDNSNLKHLMNSVTTSPYGEGTEYSLRDQLRSMELEEQEEDILVDIFAYGTPVRAIRTKYGFTSMRSFYVVRDRIFNKLKARGFSLSPKEDEDGQ